MSQADLFECAYCQTAVKEDDVFWGEDGSEAFCSTECRSNAGQDDAINRAEARSDWR